MKFLISLASKYIGRQKFRTILTFLSIMLASFILCFSVFTVNSIMASIKEKTLQTEGTWEVDLTDVLMESDNPPALIKKIKNHIFVDDYYYRSEISVSNNISSYKKIPVKITSNNGFEMTAETVRQISYSGNYELNIRLGGKERIVRKDGIILPDVFQENGYQKGDRITLTFSTENSGGEPCSESFTIEGFSNSYGNYFEMETYYSDTMLRDFINANNEFPVVNYQYNGSVRIIKDVDFQKAVDTVLKDTGTNKNYIDLMLQRNLNSSLLLLELRALVNPGVFIVIFALLFLIIFIMWLMARFIIDNAFEISVTERHRKFNVLKTLGASKAQLAALTFAEAMFYCLTAIPVGGILAYIILRYLFSSFALAGIPGVVFSVHPIAVSAGIVLCFISVIISSYTSAVWSTRKMTLVKALNFGNNIKKKKSEKINTEKLYKSPWGFIRLYTKRNISRTKGKFIFSAFAGSVSVIMLIVSAFSGIMFSELLNAGDDVYDMSIDFYIDYSGSIENLKKQFDNDENFSDIVISGRSMFSPLYGNIENDEFDKITAYSEGKNYRSISVNSVSEKTYNKICQKIFNRNPEIQYDELKNSRKAVLIAPGGNTCEKSAEDLTVHLNDGSDFVIDGIITVTDDIFVSGMYYGYEPSILVPEENMLDYRFNIISAYLKVKDPLSYQAAKEVFNSFVIGNNDVSYNEDMYMSGTGLKSFVNAIFKTAVVLLIFVWLTSIISMINLTNTRIINSQREYYILRCTGITRKHLTAAILLEVIIFSALSTFFGVILGSGMFMAVMAQSEFLANAINKIIAAGILTAVISLVSNITIPVIFAMPLIKRVYSTSSEAANANELR